MKKNDLAMVASILTFWFEETTQKQKYSKDDVFDVRIRETYEETYWKIMSGETESWRETANGRLAEIVVLDQFARNMFRDDAQSFAGDALALWLAQEAVAVEADAEISEEQKQYFYMPFMHSQSKEVHEEALRIFTERGGAKMLEYEIKHKKIIDRFGRYPHRNVALGRESTPEEIEFLKERTGF